MRMSMIEGTMVNSCDVTHLKRDETVEGDKPKEMGKVVSGRGLLSGRKALSSEGIGMPERRTGNEAARATDRKRADGTRIEWRAVPEIRSLPVTGKMKGAETRSCPDARTGTERTTELEAPRRKDGALAESEIAADAAHAADGVKGGVAVAVAVWTGIGEGGGIVPARQSGGASAGNGSRSRC
jgi:hypothetical protein